MKPFARVLFFSVVLALLSIGWKPAGTVTSERIDFGKIYLTDTHLFVSELTRGVNIYDITTLSAIHSDGYLRIEGNADIAIRDKILYADSYEDLLIFDLSDITRPVLIDSVPNIFKVNRSQGVIIEDPSNSNAVGGLDGCAPSCNRTDAVTSPGFEDGGRSNGGILNGGGTNGGKGQTGQGGSTARFVINNKWLYCIDAFDLIVFDISQPRKPKLEGRVAIGFNIETLFFYRDYLFVGSQTGMHIFDATDIRIPKKVGEFRHGRACDPVVVEETRAFVTLRSSNSCGLIEDAMHVVDIKDVMKPTLLATYPMEGPIGLAIDDGIVYVCDKSFVKIVDAKNEREMKLLSSIPLPNSYDVIQFKNLLFITGVQGIHIYAIDNPSNPVFISRIANGG